MPKNNLLKNKTIIITGANKGIGYEFAKYFLNKNCKLILIGRNKARNDISLKMLIKHSNNKTNIHFETLDISNTKKVDKFFITIFKKYKKIDVLINNAGIYGPKGDFDKIPWKEFKKTLNINLFGSIYFIKKLLPHFKENNYGRIIQLSGGGATSAFPFFSPYSVSKTAIVRFIENISKEVSKYNIALNSIAPGPVNTGMLEEVLKAGPTIVGKRFYEKSVQQKNNGGTNINMIISLAEFLITRKDNKINGRLISAIWDNWKVFDKKIYIFKNSEFGTLRRISGKDRKLNIFDK